MKISEDGTTYAWDGSVSFGPSAWIQGIKNLLNIKYNLEARKSYKQGHYKDIIKEINTIYKINYSSKPLGLITYQDGEYIGCCE